MTKKTANPRQKCKAAFTLSVQGKRSRTAIGNAVASSPLQSEREGGGEGKINQGKSL